MSEETKSEQKPRKKKNDEEKLPPWVERYKVLKRAIERDRNINMPAMKTSYKAFTPDGGLTRILLKIDDDGTAGIATNKSFADDVLNYLQCPELIYNPIWQWDYERTLKFSNFYSAICELIEEPKAFRWKGESGYCYQRLPWELRGGNIDLWTQFLSRLSNRQAFCDWIGSLFLETSYMQDYVWVQGMGEDGKGVLNRFLHRVFGKAYRATQPPRSEHWHQGLIGKRLVVFPDCNNTKFVTSGEFKSLTGGDPIEINPKHESVFTYMPKAKYLFFSNERPEISSERADMRRLILCEFDPKAPKIDSDDFEGALWDQGGPFIHSCILGYAQRSNGKQPVRQDEEALDNVRSLVSTIEEEFQVVTDSAFFFSNSVSLTPADMTLVVNRFKTHAQRREYRAWLERKYGIKKKSVRVNGQRDGDRYFGLCLRYEQARSSATTLISKEDWIASLS